MKRLLSCLALAAAACTPADDGTLAIYATEADAALLRDGLDFIGDERLVLVVTDAPQKSLGTRGGAEVAVGSDARCDDCYRLDASGRAVTVTGGGVLGRQYGVWHALELFGYRFTNPWHTHRPARFDAVTAPADDFAPQVKKRRGLHLHTLHPTEQYQYVWEPDALNLEGALRTVDFVVKNRGNYLQWCALDNIEKKPELLATWQTHTRAITTFAHAHGVNTGIALQLFGDANLQLAFDLIDTHEGDVVGEMERRLHLLLDGNGFDTLNLSFGEFGGEEPGRFVAEVNQAWAAMQRVQPGAEVTATIHVGNFDNLRVDYMGETSLLYYFLVKFAEPAIVPWVHTTMYYNLYEDSGLAYNHEAFDEHRAYIEGLLAEGKPVGYFPESAYWIAFDINVPLFLPLYLKSRHLDLQRLNGLDDHVLFSSGWEWGYWLTDAYTLRETYTRSATWDDSVKQFYAGWQGEGEKAASIVARLAEAQHRALMLERLTAYVVARDAIIDAGDALGIYSQPDRFEFSQVIAMTPEARANFRAQVVDRLKVHADEVSALAAEVERLAVGDDRVLQELVDGVRVTASRVRFSHAAFKGAADFADGEDVSALLDALDAELTFSQDIVRARRGRYFHPRPLSLVAKTQPNATLYQYGYLRETDTLCFWNRERAQLRNAVGGETNAVPGCVL